MNLAVDIGNKKIKIGVFKNKKLIEFSSFLTSEIENFSFPEDWKIIKIEKCGISSVVPEVNSIIEEKIEKIFKIKPIFLNYRLSRIKLKVKNPEKTGIDRIVNCKAGKEIFGSPLIVIDIGTAITIDVVNEKGEFIGGFILPGPELWINSFKNTSQIKEIKKSYGKFIGKETSSAIYLGLKYGLSGSIEKIAFKIKEKYKKAKIILTGGYCKDFSDYLKFEKEIRKNLTLEGINLILNEI